MRTRLALCLLLVAACNDSTADPDGGPDFIDASAIADARADASAVPDAMEIPDAGPDAASTCAHDECSPGDLLAPGCSSCVTSICNADPYCCETAWDALCIGAAKNLCGLECPAFCGDGTCDPTEDPEGCPEDCSPFCGDGICDGTESCSSCEDDCGACVCGDAVCSPGECGDCPTDCPNGCSCPHSICEIGDLLDAGCDSCAAQICAVDSFCCETSWDGYCVQEVETVCGKSCPVLCGDFVCEPPEDPSSCPGDCFGGGDGGVPLPDGGVGWADAGIWPDAAPGPSDAGVPSP